MGYYSRTRCYEPLSKHTSNLSRLNKEEHLRWTSAETLPNAHEIILEIFTAWRHICTLSRLHRSSALDLYVPKSETQSINHLCREQHIIRPSTFITGCQFRLTVIEHWVLIYDASVFSVSSRVSLLGMGRVLAIQLHQSRVDFRV